MSRKLNPTRASASQPVEIPAPSGGGVGWGQISIHWERAPPARSHHLQLLLCLRLTRYPPDPTRTSASQPVEIPAPSGGGVGWGRYCMRTHWERAPPARSHHLQLLQCLRLTRYPPDPTRTSASQPVEIPAPSGGGVGWGRVSIPWERAPTTSQPAASQTAVGCCPKMF